VPSTVRKIFQSMLIHSKKKAGHNPAFMIDPVSV